MDGGGSLMRRTMALAAALLAGVAAGEEPLHERIDALIEARAGDQVPLRQASDAEFLRRVRGETPGQAPTEQVELMRIVEACYESTEVGRGVGV